MAHFYGTVDGSARTQATRRGTVKEPVTTHAASWQGAVRVDVFVGPDGADWCEVSLVPWRNVGVTRQLYRGPVGEYRPEVS